MKQKIFIFALLCFCGPLMAVEPYKAKNYDALIGNLPGLSDEALKMHFTLYQGYVSNTNKLLDLLDQMDNHGKGRSSEFAGLKRMLGWEFDGMRLHEYYFENLASSPLDQHGSFYKDIVDQFGSFNRWREDFINTGLMRGIGWVVLYKDAKTGRLTNAWINEHDLGHLAGSQPLLVMDVFEHAYITQYGLDRSGYIEAFFDNINWKEVEKRHASGL